MLSTVGRVFPAVLLCITLFYVTAKVSRGHRSMLRLSKLKNRVLGLGVSKSGSYFVLVLVFVGGFCSSAYVAWIGRKNLFYQERVKF